MANEVDDIRLDDIIDAENRAIIAAGGPKPIPEAEMVKIRREITRIKAEQKCGNQSSLAQAKN